jgi:16S rRNA (guanine1207-N2)-methyltransferase
MTSLPQRTKHQICEVVAEWRQMRGKTASSTIALVNPPTSPLAAALEKVAAPLNVEPCSYLAAEDGAAVRLPSGEGALAGAVIFASKQRLETLGLAARLHERIEPGGLLLFCCPNALGAKGFQGRFEKAFETVRVHLAHSWRLLELSGLTAEGARMLAEWRGQTAAQLIPGTTFHTVPGIYGWNKIDAGSRLLVDSISWPLRGRGLDLGCGYGYLSSEALSRSQAITALTLVDHDWRALECARQNLETFAVAKEFVWTGVRQFRPKAPVEWVLLNPPFHTGQQMDLTLGRAFIAAAHGALQPRGVLYLVANSFLPYADLLRTLFAQVEPLRSADGFTVFRAEKE